MLDGSNFLKKGWLLGLKRYQFEIAEDLMFLVMGKMWSFQLNLGQQKGRG